MASRFDPRFHLRVEPLEDRTVPANFTAATVPELIAAIDAANLNSEADTVTLAPGTTFTLTAANNSTHGPAGLPVITGAENLRIVGNNDIVERSSAKGTPAFRLFDVAAGASLTLESLTLQGGLSAGNYTSGYVAAGGGRLLTRRANDFRLRHSEQHRRRRVRPGRAGRWGVHRRRHRLDHQL